MRSRAGRPSQRVPCPRRRGAHAGGRRRVDELLEQLAAAAGGRAWLVRFAAVREAEADGGRLGDAGEVEPGDMLTEPELDALLRGFMTIRDQEPRDDVANWANAVIALLEDEIRR